MRKKIKIAILLIGIYLIVFWIGFKSGGIYLRMHNKIQAEKIEIAMQQEAPPEAPPIDFLLVEKINYDKYSTVNFEELHPVSIIMKIFNNEKLRPLLKLRNIEIYKGDGERIY